MQVFVVIFEKQAKNNKTPKSKNSPPKQKDEDGQHL